MANASTAICFIITTFLLILLAVIGRRVQLQRATTQTANPPFPTWTQDEQSLQRFVTSHRTPSVVPFHQMISGPIRSGTTETEDMPPRYNEPCAYAPVAPPKAHIRTPTMAHE